MNTSNTSQIAFKLTYILFLFFLSIPKLEANEANYNACAIDLCGHPNDNYAFGGNFDSKITSDLETKSFISSIIKPKLKELVVKETLISNLASEQISLFLSNKIELNIYQKNYANIQFANLYFSQPDIAKAIRFNDGFYQVDKDAVIRDVQNKQRKEFLSDLADIYNLLLKQKEIVTNINMANQKVTFRNYLKLKTLFLSKEKSQEKLNQILNSEILQHISDYQKKLGSMVLLDFNLDLLEKAKSPETLTSYEDSKIISMLRMSNLYRVALSDSFIQQVSNKLKTPSELFSIFEKQSDFFKQSNLEEAVSGFNQKNESICIDSIRNKIASSSSKIKNKQFRSLIELTKESAKEAASKYFTGLSLKDAHRLIDNASVSLEEENESDKETIKNTIDDTLNEKQKILEMLTDKSKFRLNIEEKFLLLLLFFQPGNNKTEAVVNKAAKLCKRFAPSFFEDSAISEHIDLSWQSVRWAEYGVGTLAHELGHVLSMLHFRLIRDNPEQDAYEKTKTCNAKRHKEISSKLINRHAYSHGQFDEEDWADTFSISTINILQKKWPHIRNNACPLLVPTSSSQFNETFFNTPKYNSGSARHSPTLLRALTIHLGMGMKIPKSCEAALGHDLTDFLQTNQCNM